LQWDLLGEHNLMNGLVALAASRHAGVPVNIGIDALRHFKNVKRRMEVCGVRNGVTVYDDFAHHPTAIRTTLEGLRNKVKDSRIIAVLEPRSNTMKMGIWKDSLAHSLAPADQVFCYNANLGWDAREAMVPLGTRAVAYDNLDQLIAAIKDTAQPGDHVLVMSNGAFGGLHERLLKTLDSKATDILGAGQG
jgi:UDP-N-acetylmuramate: L-alanyl-gamma-D-glutamyl-meso-diaminopimelate ligase